MADNHSIVFRGDILPGFSLEQVRGDLKTLFNLDEQRLAQLFSGRPLTIKKQLSREQAELFQKRMAAIGAQVSIRAESDSEQPASPMARDDTADPPLATGAESEQGMSLAPVGADVLRDNERSQHRPAQVSTDHLSLDEPGADVLRPEERRKVEVRELNLDHLKIESP